MTKRLKFLWPAFYAFETILNSPAAILFVVSDRILHLGLLLFSRKMLKDEQIVD